MISRRQAIAAGAAFATSGWAQGAANRVALVIGNAAYPAAPLPNAANDAKAMGATLRRMGFEVIELRDAGKQRMEEAITLMRALLQGRNGIGLLYYAGHGLQMDWHNYMVPVDAQMSSAADVPHVAVDIQGAIDAFRAAGNRMNIVVLDACRDNPFAGKATGKGLAPLDAPPGTYLAYATAPGNYAEDGDAADGNGLYTRFLLKEMERPQAKIEDVFKRVRLQVRQASKGRQVPWDSSSLEDDFIFATGQSAVPATATEREQGFDEERRQWDLIKVSTKPEDFFDFLKRYPTGAIAELAQFRLDQLTAPAIVPSQLPAHLASLPSGANRWAVGDQYLYRERDLLTGKDRDFQWQVERTIGDEVHLKSGAVFTQMGAVIQDRIGRRSPPQLTVPADLSLGKRWRCAYLSELRDGKTIERCYDESRVVSLDSVGVPAGKFLTFRIERRVEVRAPGYTSNIAVDLWVDPSTMMQIKQTLVNRDLQGQIQDSRTRELTSYFRAPRG